MYHRYGLIGFVLVIVSYYLNSTKIITNDGIGLILPHYLFIIGLFLFFDGINYKINNNSLLYRLTKKDHLWLKLIFVGSVIGIIFEIYGVFISNLWYSYFQDWSLAQQVIHYPLGIIIGYGLPTLLYYSMYNVVSSLIPKRSKRKNTKIPQKFFNLLRVIGVVFLLLPLVLYKMSLGWNPIIRGLLFAFSLFGLWFILEYYEHKQHKNTFITTLFQKNFKPLFSMVIISLIISISWEYLNALRPSWVYQNLPLINVTILGLPIGIIIAWPMLFVVYFSAYRVLFKDKEKIW